MNIGTLFRCAQATEGRIAFFLEAGLDYIAEAVQLLNTTTKGL